MRTEQVDPELTAEERINLRICFDRHMSLRIDRLLDCLKMAGHAQEKIDKISSIINQPANISESQIFVPVVFQKNIFTSSIGALDTKNYPSDLFWKEDFPLLLAREGDAENIGNEAGFCELSYFMSIAIRYYFEQMRTEKFSILHSVPEMLTVDRIATEMIAKVFAMASIADDTNKERIRLNGKKISDKGRKDSTWNNIVDGLKKMAREEEHQKKQYAISTIAGLVIGYMNSPITQDIILKTIKRELGLGTLPKKGRPSRENQKYYFISEILQIIEKN
jgi:hypothetical protein